MFADLKYDFNDIKKNIIKTSVRLFSISSRSNFQQHQIGREENFQAHMKHLKVLHDEMRLMIKFLPPHIFSEPWNFFLQFQREIVFGVISGN